VLRCRYHGWSYDSRGKLIKAPEFENVQGFDKDLNGLWEVKTEIRESMVFVNLDVGNEVTSQVLGGVENDLRRWGANEMISIEEWKFEGKFNWKLAGKCPYRLGQFVLTYVAGSLLRIKFKKAGLLTFLSPFTSEEYLDVFDTSIFHRLSSGELLTLRLLPLSRNSTTVECTLYSSESGTSRKKIDGLKMEGQLAMAELEVLQNALVHAGLEISDRK
jgi:hypothetical protein